MWRRPPACHACAACSASGTWFFTAWSSFNPSPWCRCSAWPSNCRLATRPIRLSSGACGLFSTRPFYNPATFDWRAMRTATSFAALTYIGFDGLTTLAEDAHNPRRNVLLAIVLVVLLTALFSGFQAYLGQLVWPQFH